MRARPAAFFLLLLLGGCGGVLSKHPASDDATARLDERLLGYWRIESVGESKQKDDLEQAILVIGRRAGSERDLEILAVSLRPDRTIQSQTTSLTATTIGAKDYLSVRRPPDPGSDANDVAWLVIRYELPDECSLRVLALDERVVAADVRAGKVSGSVPDVKDVASSVTVKLDASTAALRKYLEARGDDVYRKDRPIVLRRLRCQ